MPSETEVHVGVVVLQKIAPHYGTERDYATVRAILQAAERERNAVAECAAVAAAIGKGG